jgi:hypothetical protein
MNGSMWVGFAVGAFVVLIAALLVVVLVGRRRASRVAPLTDEDQGYHAPPPHPGGQGIPPTGSR